MSQTLEDKIRRVKEGINQQIEGARRRGWHGIQGTYEDALAVIEELEKKLNADVQSQSNNT